MGKYNWYLEPAALYSVSREGTWNTILRIHHSLFNLAHCRVNERRSWGPSKYGTMNSFHRSLNWGSVGSICEICADLTAPRSSGCQCSETISKIACSSREVRIRTIEVGKISGERWNSELFLEYVDFVQEDNERLVLEPSVVVGRRLEFYYYLVHHRLYLD